MIPGCTAVPRAVGVTVVSGFYCSEPKGLIGSGVFGLIEVHLCPPRVLSLSLGPQLMLWEAPVHTERYHFSVGREERYFPIYILETKARLSDGEGWVGVDNPSKVCWGPRTEGKGNSMKRNGRTGNSRIHFLVVTGPEPCYIRALWAFRTSISILLRNFPLPRKRQRKKTHLFLAEMYFCHFLLQKG